MKIDILTLFPEFFSTLKTHSIIKRSIEKGLIQIEAINFRDFSTDRLKRVDYPPIGGGNGMIISLPPIVACLNKMRKPNSKVILLSAKGRKYNQEIAKKYAKEEHLILISGHYEGIDDRILHYVDDEICIGDYILTGGEIPAMIMVDSITRLLPGAIKLESHQDESFENHHLLEYPQYTIPRVFEGYAVPDILYSGNHQEIAKYRFQQSILKTKQNRPELLEKEFLAKEETSFDLTIQKAQKFMMNPQDIPSIFQLTQKIDNNQLSWQENEMIYQESSQFLQIQKVLDMNTIVRLENRENKKMKLGKNIISSRVKALFLNVEATEEGFLEKTNLSILYIKEKVETFSFLSLPTTLQYISVDKNNLYFSSKNFVLFNKDKTELLFYPPMLPEEEYKIPKTIKKVASTAFSNCPYLKRLYVPKSLSLPFNLPNTTIIYE